MAQTLFDYMKQIQRFLRDQKQEFINPNDLVSYINRARREIALRTQCIRCLPSISGQIISADLNDGGSGYSSSPTVTISAPDFPSGRLPYPNGLQAEASVTVVGGVITNISIDEGGAGYFEPTITITDATGSGADITLNMSFINQLAEGQEVYSFSSVDLSEFPGVSSIIAIKSVSLIYANYRYSLPCYSFSTYQAMIRQYPFQYQYVPTFCAQYGQGANGSFYMYPIPSQAYQMEWDCFCYPQNLVTDNDVDIIAEPWQDAIPYLGAHYAFLEIQNFNAARLYLDLYDRQLAIFSKGARPGRWTNPYGRW